MDYSDRTGYSADFLKPGKRDGRVFLPTLSKALLAQAVRLEGRPTVFVLPYHHYSVVMHRERRFALYSAANVDFSGRFDMPRPKDRWLVDRRVPESVQTVAAFYEGNQLDRGHLTRREDMEYGPSRPLALATAADTCHWTNCVPQHSKFNQGRELWQGIERHILEDTVAPDQFRAQVLTGPVFDAADPMLDRFPESPYPLRYWKVAAAINASGKLFGTAYVLDQRGVINQFGLRGTPEVPFGPYKTFQTTIAEVERLTGLTFQAGKGSRRVPLSEFDPMARRRGVREAGRASEYRELGSPSDIIA